MVKPMPLLNHNPKPHTHLSAQSASSAFHPPTKPTYNNPLKSAQSASSVFHPLPPNSPKNDPLKSVKSAFSAFHLPFLSLPNPPKQHP